MKVLYCPRNGKLVSLIGSLTSPETDLNFYFCLTDTGGIGGEEIMKKTLLTSSILAAINLSVQPVFADDSLESDEHILVTASRSQQDSYLALSSNQIITRAEIEKLQVTSVGDILKTVAGITVANQGDAGQSTSIYTRGTNSNHTLVLIDGVRVGSATLGTVNLSAISPQQIERIEIVKGPRAALWGSDAIGGVIQLFTKRYGNGEGQVSIGTGSNGLLQGSASIGFGNNNHQYTVNVTKQKADGFNAYTSDPNNPYDINEPDEDGYSRQSVSLSGQSQLNDAFAVNIVGRYEQSDSDYDASYPDSPCWDDPSKACPSYYANQTDADNYHLKVAGQYNIDALSLELTLAKSQDQAATHGNGIKKGDADEIATNRDQVSVVGNYQFSQQTGLTFGGDWYKESVSTNTDKVSWVPGFQAWAVDERKVKALFVQGRHQIDDFVFELAGRRDKIEKLDLSPEKVDQLASTYDSESTYNASIGYQLSQQWLISVNSGTGFKAPTFNDLYWPGSGNPALNPESSTTHELLVRRQAQNSNMEISVYDTDVEDLIAWSPNEFGLWQPANINQATMKGIDLSYSRAFDNFDYQVALAYVDSEDGATGDELLRRPKFTADYVFNYNWQQWQFGAVISYRDESKDAGDVTLDDYWLVDLTANIQVNEQLNVSAKIVNALDEDYQSALNYKADGTSYRISASYTF